LKTAADLIEDAFGFRREPKTSVPHTLTS
jgi:hypothetical protein